MRVIVATNNRGKLAELSALLPDGVELLTLADAGLESPDETGATFRENALLKARAAAPHADAAVADDSGLVVDALDGAPGVYSARYAGPDASDEDNNRTLLAALANVPDDARSCAFVSAVAWVTAPGDELTAEGRVSGRVLRAPRGTGGFGYDPLFEIMDPDGGEFNGRAMAELTRDEKNRISHRGRALRALLRTIEEHGGFSNDGSLRAGR